MIRRYQPFLGWLTLTETLRPELPSRVYFILPLWSLTTCSRECESLLDMVAKYLREDNWD